MMVQYLWPLALLICVTAAALISLPAHAIHNSALPPSTSRSTISKSLRLVLRMADSMNSSTSGQACMMTSGLMQTSSQLGGCDDIGPARRAIGVDVKPGAGGTAIAAQIE